MCYGCWAQDGAHQIDTPAVREAARLIGTVYEYSCVGGGLHVAIDDFNLAGEIRRYSGADGTPEQVAAENACAAALNALTFEERCSALGLYDGYWTPSSPERTTEET